MTNSPQYAELPATARLETRDGGTSVIRVETESMTGEVHLLGAHVTSWHPRGTGEVLWMSDASAFAVGKPIRGGIPVCFPWFAAGRDGEMTPTHGLVRLVPWQLVEAEEVGEGVRIVLEVDTAAVRNKLAEADANADLRAAADGLEPFHVRYDVTFGDALDIVVTVTNTSEDEALSFEEALHTYFDVGHVGEVRIAGLDGADYYDKVAQAEATQEGDVVLTEFTDRVYDSSADVRIEDAGLERTVRIDTENSADTVVWNPWADRDSLPDIPAGAWPGFLCVESANVGGHAVDLRPGEKHTMRVRYGVDTTR